MSSVADSLQITGDRLGGAQEADDERSGVVDDMAADAVATTEVVDDDDVDDASDDGDVEAAFTAHRKNPPRSQNGPRPVSAAVAQHSATVTAAAGDAGASRARPYTATVRRHHQPGADDVDEASDPARRSLTALRKRQTGRLSADHIEKLTAMLRTAVNATGSNCGLLNAAHNPLGLSRPASAAAATTTQSRPSSAAPVGAGRAAARASRPGTAHPTRSRPTSAAAAAGAQPPSAASTTTTRQRPQSATSSARHHDFQSSVRSASGAGAAAFNQPASSSFAALERRYLDGIASSKHETLRRAKLTSRSLHRRYAGGVRQDDDALPLAESDTDGDVNADGTVGAGYSAAGASRPTSAAVGRTPSGARSRPRTAAASRSSAPAPAAPHRPVSGSTRSSSSQRRPLNQSASASAPAASSSSHVVDVDPTATLGTAQVLAVRAEDEGWALGRSPSTTRGSSFFDAHDTAPGITNYLRQVKRTRVSPFAVGAEKSATTRAQQASRRDRIERDRKAAASYIADYVSALGPLHLEP